MNWVWFLTWAFARISTRYDSRFNRGKYVVIRHEKWAKWLIETEGFWDKGRETLQKDRQKMALAGLLFYVSNVVLMLLTAVLWWIPDIPCTPIEWLTVSSDTLNEKIPIIGTIVLMCAELWYLMIVLFQYRKEIEPKWIRWIGMVVAFAVMAVCGIAIVSMLWELFL